MSPAGSHTMDVSRLLLSLSLAALLLSVSAPVLGESGRSGNPVEVETKVNSFAPDGRKPALAWLTTRQRLEVERLAASP